MAYKGLLNFSTSWCGTNSSSVSPVYLSLLTLFQWCIRRLYHVRLNSDEPVRADSESLPTTVYGLNFRPSLGAIDVHCEWFLTQP